MWIQTFGQQRGPEDHSTRYLCAHHIALFPASTYLSWPHVEPCTRQAKPMFSRPNLNPNRAYHHHFTDFRSLVHNQKGLWQTKVGTRGSGFDPMSIYVDHVGITHVIPCPFSTCLRTCGLCDSYKWTSSDIQGHPGTSTPRPFSSLNQLAGLGQPRSFGFSSLDRGNLMSSYWSAQ